MGLKEEVEAATQGVIPSDVSRNFGLLQGPGEPVCYLRTGILRC